MKVKELAVRNGLWNALSTGFAGVTGLLGSVLVVRSLPSSDYGVFSYYLWLASIAVAVATLALPISLTKVTSELIGQGDDGEASALSVSVILGVLALGTLITLGFLIWAFSASSSQRIFLLIIAAVMVPHSVTPVLLSVLWGRQRYKPVAIMLLVASCWQLALIGLAFREGWGSAGFVVAILSGNVVNAAGLCLVLARGRDAIYRSWREFRLPRQSTQRRFVAFLVPATFSQLFTVVVWSGPKSSSLNG
ncbi:MAG: oligosaccharide flippase family protein [Chloroflexota bacterium]|nr:oligosaccharide flippase family protein [Chloroflexota bacterium]